MNSIWAGLFAAALGIAGLGLVYGLVHLREATAPAPARLWALGALFAVTVGVWETWLIVSGTYRSLPHLLGLFNGALLALGPCLFLQARAVAGLTTGRWLQATQFLPFAIHAGLLAAYLWPLDAAHKRELAELSMSASGQSDWVGTAKLLHLAVYSGLIIATTRQGLVRMHAQLSRFDAAELYWIAGFAAALGATALALLALGVVAADIGAGDLNNAGSLILAGLAVAIAVRSLRDDARNPVKPAPRYARSGVDDERLAAFARRIESAMSQNELHTDPELTLDALAKVVGLTPQQVSQALNQQLGVTFYRFVNQQRVAAAKRLLAESDLNVLDAAMQAGFATKATFNKTFKAETGQTPTQFRASCGC